MLLLLYMLTCLPWQGWLLLALITAFLACVHV